MWDLPRPGLEPLSPALAGGFLTTAPPGKPPTLFLNDDIPHIYAPNPLSFLILYAFLKDTLICVHVFSHHLFAVDFQIYISNLYLSFEFQT